MWEQYEWIVVVGGLMSFFVAYGIGANDVANAFATSVGAKSITIQQAIIIAGICEFLGSVLLGSQVTNTIRKNIAKGDEFDDQPEVLMYGMLCVLGATGIWLLLASYLELPVSTTHSVIGGIMGMAITARGMNAVVWYGTKDEAPYVKGVVTVFMSWLISPVLSALIAVALFVSVRKLILEHPPEVSRARAVQAFPFMVGITFVIMSFFIIYKGFSREINGKELGKDILHWYGSTLVSLAAGGVAAGLLHVLMTPKLRRQVRKVAITTDMLADPDEEDQNSREPTALKPRKVGAHQEGDEEDAVPGRKYTQLAASSRSNRETNGELEMTVREEKTKQPVGHSGRDSVLAAVNQVIGKDMHSVVEEDAKISEIHDAADDYDPATEEAFKFLQVFTAACDSFAHGANDVANSIGPFAAIISIYKDEAFESDSSVPIWILALGGFGIVVGLSTYGYNVMRAIGVKLVKMSPSRGFCIELGASAIIVFGSWLGIPLSTTHCQVGGEVGVGLLYGTKAVNFMLFYKVVIGWLVTLVIVGFTTAAFFAQGVYSPSIPNLNAIDRYKHGINSAVWNLSSLNVSGINTTEANRLFNLSTDTSAAEVRILNDSVFAVVDQFGST